jgi:hypothetical protein
VEQERACVHRDEKHMGWISLIGIIIFSTPFAAVAQMKGFWRGVRSCSSRDNPTYSKEQAQTDFDAHVLKAATAAARKSAAQDVTEALL